MTIEQLHDDLFDLLCRIDDICRQEGVRYFLDSGTEIGAVRDKDFIPWDDDMDLKVMAEDYPAFKAAMKKHLPEHIKLIEPNDFAPHFYDFSVRVADTTKPVRAPNEEDDFYGNLANFVGTDVFVYAKAPASPRRRRWFMLRIKILYGMGMAHRYVLKDEKYTKLQKVQVWVLTHLGKLFSAGRICRMWWKTLEKYQNSPKASGRMPGNYLRHLQIFEDDCFEGTATGIIRGREFPIPGGFDKELTQQYGDYMTPKNDPTEYIQHLT